MRFYEFKPHTKPVKPLTPPQARLNKLKQTVELGKTALKTEKAFQKRQRGLVKQSKQAHNGRSTNNPNQTL